MSDEPETIGVLLVHGMGEQKSLEHLRGSARELASFVGDAPDLVRLSVVDQTGEPWKGDESIVIDAVFRRDAGEAQVRLHLHEVWWADLGISGGLIEHVKFWLWGLGQWAAEVARSGHPGRNTEKLMAMPRFGFQATPMDVPSLWRELPSRLLLFAAGLLAILTFFTWSAAKQLVSLLSRRLPNPSLIFMFLGDVKIYERPGGPGKGTLADPDLPIRATIRRRIVRAMTAMAARPYDRWYVLAHSLGGVVAYNALQETELALPNYLTEAEWKKLPAAFRTSTPFIPAGETPSTDNMMPRRPPWLGGTEGIDRRRLFERFAGLVTFGCPLDKFAALWPRVVCLNRQAAVFPIDSEWVNLHDPTDPVAARIDAFAPPHRQADTDVLDRIPLVPRNFACRASRWFGLAHVRYFRPRRRSRRSMGAAIAEALVSGRRTTLAQAASRAAIPAAESWLRMLAAVAQLLLVALLMTLAGAALLIAVGKALPDAVTELLKRAVAWLSPGLLTLLQGGGWPAVLASVPIVLGLAFVATLVAGIARALADVRTNSRRTRRFRS